MPVIGSLPGHAGVQVIDDPAPHAFCAGYLRPDVYVSRGAVDLLSPDELAAVLSHERHHRQSRDPLRFAVGRVLTQALFFLPALGRLDDLYRELAEHRADAFAVSSSAGESAALASALLTFESTGGGGISPERVDSLLGQPPRFRLPSPLMALSLALVSGLIVVLWRASAAASARATLNLPGLSSKPCMLVLAFVPVCVAAAALTSASLHRSRRLAG